MQHTLRVLCSLVIKIPNEICVISNEPIVKFHNFEGAGGSSAFITSGSEVQTIFVYLLN